MSSDTKEVKRRKTDKIEVDESIPLFQPTTVKTTERVVQALTAADVFTATQNRVIRFLLGQPVSSLALQFLQIHDLANLSVAVGFKKVPKAVFEHKTETLVTETFNEERPLKQRRLNTSLAQVITEFGMTSK